MSCKGNEKIIIETPSGQQAVFSVSIAQTPEDKQKGLMFVEHMPEGEGMLFLNDAPKQMQFWMKNTLIPLDMLFFDAKGELVHIEHAAKPHDLTPRGPHIPVCAVLEINGGLARAGKIIEGSKLITHFTQECLQSLMK